MYANATTFNDPFDCHPNLIDFSKVPSERCKIWDAAVIEDLESNRYINYRNDLWICCLSKVYDSLLMWSYYNKHVGVCIGLNMEYVKNIFMLDMVWWLLRKVRKLIIEIS